MAGPVCRLLVQVVLVKLNSGPSSVHAKHAAHLMSELSRQFRAHKRAANKACYQLALKTKTWCLLPVLLL